MIDESQWTSINKEIKFVSHAPYEKPYNFENYFGNIDVNIQNFFITVGHLGCSTALLYKHDNTDKPKQPGFDEMRKHIHVFKQNGQLLSKFEVDRSVEILCLHYLISGNIIVLLIDGTISIYTQKGLRIKQFRLATDIRVQQQVIQYSLTNDAACLVYSDMSVIYCENITKTLYTSKQPKIKSVHFQQNQFENNQFNIESLKCVQFIPVDLHKNEQPILVSIIVNQQNQESIIHFNYLKDENFYKSAVYQLPRDESIQLTPSGCQFDSVKLHPLEPLLLYQTYQTESRLTVISIHSFLENGTDPTVELSHNLVIYEDFLYDFCQDLPAYYNQLYSTLYLLSPSKQGIQELDIYLGQVVQIQQEADGLNLVTAEQKAGYVQIIQVQQSVKNVYSVNLGGKNQHLYYGNQLLEAFNCYKQAQSDTSKITQSDSLLRNLGDNLQEAIKQLLKAVDDAYSYDSAVELLQAVCYAKLYLPIQQQLQVTRLYDLTRNHLRLRNDLSKNSSQLNLSGVQYFCYSTFEQLISIICSQGYFEQAISLNKYSQQQLNTQDNSDNDQLQKILIQQTITTVLSPENQFTTDKELFQQINQKISNLNINGVYRQCAEFLTKESQRFDLVGELIEREPSLVDQVRLYCDMKKYDKAVRKAYDQCSEELVLESLRSALHDSNCDRNQFLTLLLNDAEPNETPSKYVEKQQEKEDQSQFGKYIKQLIYNQVASFYKITAQMPELAQYKDVLQDDALLEEVCCILQNQTLKYQYNLLKYQKEQLQQKQITHNLYLQTMQECNGEHVYSAWTIQAVGYLQDRKQQVFNVNEMININLQQILKLYGREAIKVNLSQCAQGQNQYFQAANSVALGEAKQFISKIKHDLYDYQLLLLILFGIIDGIYDYSQQLAQNLQSWCVMAGFSLVEDYFKSLSKSNQQKVAGPLLYYMNNKLGSISILKSLNTILVQLTSDKTQILKTGCVLNDKELVLKAMESNSLEQRELLMHCYKSVKNEVWEAALVYIKGGK